MTDASRPLHRACDRFAWCALQGRGHTEHRSAGVRVPGGEEAVLYAETAPDSGDLVYGPVVGDGSGDRTPGQARVLAAQLRVAAAGVDELVACAESG